MDTRHQTTDADRLRLEQYRVPERYLNGWRTVSVEQRLADAFSFLEIYENAGRALDRELRVDILKRIGFVHAELAKQMIPAMPGKSKADTFTHFVKNGTIKYRKDNATFHLYFLEGLEKAMSLINPPMTTMPPANLHETGHTRSNGDVTAVGPSMAAAMRLSNAESPRPAASADEAKFDCLRNAPYVDAEALKILAPLITLRPDERSQDHHEMLRTVTAMTMLLNHQNKRREGAFTNRMKDFGRTYGIARFMDKLADFQKLTNSYWQGDAKEERITALYALWAYLMLIINFLFLELPEAQRKAVRDRFKRNPS